MITTAVRRDTPAAVQALAAVPGVLVATWGSTARDEETPLSDVDLLCWNPTGAALPEVTVAGGYLDLVVCTGDAAALASWARANATDLHAVMFSRPAGGDPRLLPAFQEVVAGLWNDTALRAREVLHLLATTTALPRVHGSALLRPEKFGPGGTRGWSALGECASLLDGRVRHRSTATALAALAAAGDVDGDAADSFAAAMRLRRECEAGTRSFHGVSAEAYLSSARRLLHRHDDWLRTHAGDETRVMRSVFAARSGAEVAGLLDTAHGGSWWVRHAALMNAHTGDATLRRIIRDTRHSGAWWADRNLVLYAVRHPNASAALLDDVVRACPELRLMDLEAVRQRRATLAFTDHHTPSVQGKQEVR
ncbi:hypothetical protein [Actinoplanes rectilineatus]|uniref:hypothetical protein n=1 Tax=Actinoplanes rectilineatus TaxID=113571 RepID=UPI0005F2FA1C|nr:hypothetical protein [Actinoplanes rectilineatus]